MTGFPDDFTNDPIPDETVQAEDPDVVEPEPDEPEDDADVQHEAVVEP